MHASYGLGAIIGPLLVTTLLSQGLSWRLAYGIMAAAQAVFALLFTLGRRNWVTGIRRLRPPASATRRQPARQPVRASCPSPSSAVVLGALAFVAVETGIESGAGLWGYLFLTAGVGLAHAAAGAAVAAYWAMMLAGRVVLGPVAERAAPPRILAAAL